MGMDTWPLDHANPVELNRYVYAMGNPVTWSNLSGYVALFENTSINVNVSGRTLAAATVAYGYLAGCAILCDDLYNLLGEAFQELYNAFSDATDGIHIGGGNPSNSTQDTDIESLTNADIEERVRTLEEELEKTEQGDWSFVGLHGTSSNFTEAIVREIRPPITEGNSGFNQLGHGFYVLPWQEPRALEATLYFAGRSIEVHGGERAILLIFANNFDAMTHTEVPSNEWNSLENTTNFPFEKYINYNYLTAPFNDPRVAGVQQMKFNPHTYLSGRLIALPLE